MEEMKNSMKFACFFDTLQQAFNKNDDIIVMEAYTLLDSRHRAQNLPQSHTFASILHSKFGGGPDGVTLVDVNNALCAWTAAEFDPVDPNDFDIIA